MTMTPDSNSPVVDGNATKIIEKPIEEPERETWGKKIDFLLSVVGFAVDLGNVWRFPFICYRNGGGAFLLPYLIMLVFGGLPLFYMELALGQFQRCGCLTVWSRICPMFKGLGIAICIVASYVAFYYNTIIAWAMFYLFRSFTSELPWLSCNNTWNTDLCKTFEDLKNFTFKENITIITELFKYEDANNTGCFRNVSYFNYTTELKLVKFKSATEEFYENELLKVGMSDGMDRLGNINWAIALCLLAVFLMVYFALWKGIKTSGKAVWITATLPYVILIILLIRGCSLPGASDGIVFYLNPNWVRLADINVWIDAATQVFFSLGPGFGVALALSSYNKFHNNCYKDALITSAINSFTSFLAGFVVFTVLGYMSHVQQRNIDEVAKGDAGLIFIVYAEAISTLSGSTFWAILLFLMLITLGLDTTYVVTVDTGLTHPTFGGLEAIITGILDEFPKLRKRRELFVAGFICYCYIGGLITTTYGGIYVVQLFDAHGAPIPLLFVVMLEAFAICYIYGVNRFSNDIQAMLGFRPGLFWQITWKYVSPIFLFILFILSLVYYRGAEYGDYTYPKWSLVLGWLMTFSSIFFVPAYIVYKFIFTKGSFKERIHAMITPEEVPTQGKESMPVYL